MKTRVFKIKRTEGVGVTPNCSYIKYIGKSRIDGYPMFKITTELEYHGDEHSSMQKFRRLIKDALIVNTRPGYTVADDEIEMIKSVEDHLPQPQIEVKPIGPPLGVLFYVDYQYGINDTFDERLLLML